MNINKVIVAGTLVEDPALQRTPKGTAACTVVIKVTRSWMKDDKPQEEVSEIEVDIYGKAAENIHKYLHKGDPVMFEGHLKLERWTDKQSGEECQRMIVVCENQQFLPNGQGTGKRSTQSAGRRPQED